MSDADLQELRRRWAQTHDPALASPLLAAFARTDPPPHTLLQLRLELGLLSPAHVQLAAALQHPHALRALPPLPEPLLHATFPSGSLTLQPTSDPRFVTLLLATAHLDAQAVQPIRDALEALHAHRSQYVLADLRRTRYVTSVSLGALTHLHTHLDGNLTLLPITRHVGHVLELIGLDELFHVLPDLVRPSRALLQGEPLPETWVQHLQG